VRFADCALGALAVGFVLVARWSVSAGAPRTVAPRPLVRIAPLAAPVLEHTAVLRRGETASGLALRLGVAGPEVGQWLSAARGLIDVRALPVGLVGETLEDAHGSITALRLTPDWRATVVVTRGDGGFRAYRELRPVDRDIVVVHGTVHSSLFEAMSAAGESESLALELADLFQWDIDFHREVRDGDSFAVLVERVHSDGKTVAYGPVLAASYTNRGTTYTAVRYTFAGHDENYYDGQGRPLRKQFLRAPLRFTRVTSRYSLSRMHPILGRRMPHWGVDYGAPVGTPVMATADGVVVFTGWHGGGGRMVEIRHAGGFVTAYLHLSRFASGIRPGVHVSQGQVIGFVGNSGMSTGPHLDYRITQNGHHLNPMTVGKNPAPPLPRPELPRFAAWAERVLPLLGRTGALPPASVAELEAAAPVGLHG
jgi:murein DD-endopeptidase MepM/ murein hydrolase activator NlpD